MKRMTHYFWSKTQADVYPFPFLSLLPPFTLSASSLSIFLFLCLSVSIFFSLYFCFSLSISHSLSLSSLPYCFDFNRLNVFLFTYYFCIFFTSLLFFFLSIELHTECIVRARRALLICPSHFEAESVLGMSLEKKGLIPTSSLCSCSISFSPSLCYDPL